MTARQNNGHMVSVLRDEALAQPCIAAAGPALREARAFAYILEHLPIFHTSGDGLAGDFGWREQDDEAFNRRFPKKAALHTPPPETPASRLQADFHCFGGYAAAHTCIDYSKVLRLGLDGLLADVEAAGTGEFLDAMKAALRALQNLADRYAALLESVGESALAAICRKVPRRPANSFHEAMQSIWLVHLAIGLSEYSDASISLGRLDQYAFPHYRDSLAAGCADTELERPLAALVKKLNSYGDAACAVNLGGLDDQGNDLCNPLTRMIVKVVKAGRLPSPILAARIHPNFPTDLFDALIDPRLFAVGQPTFYGEHSCRSALRTRGVPEADLSRWSANSCMGLVIEGSEVSNMWGGVVNFLLPLELSVNGGAPFHKALPIEPATAPISRFDTFADLYEQFWKYLGEVAAFCIRESAAATGHVRIERPNPYLSLFLNRCIERRLDRLAGGVEFHTTIIEAFGLVNAADALYTVKTLVFDSRECRLDELVEAAKNNFEGKASLLTRIRAVPKYGNGHPAIDAFTADMADRFQRLVRSHSTPGHVYAPSFHTLNAHVGAGKKYGASLDGRLRGEPLAKNIGSSPGAATDGLTALIRSAATIDQKPYFGGQALDLTIDANLIKSQVEKRKVQSLLQTYFRLGGLQIQVNGLMADTLRKAMETPDRYRDLIVRIGGYSDYFNHLSGDAKQDMVRRAADGL